MPGPELPTPLPAAAEVVIAGGGFAGAATACCLARAGLADVVVLEAEDQFGAHASGLNASLLRRLTGDPAVAAALRHGADRMRDGSWQREVAVGATGSLLLEGPDGTLEAAVREAVAAGLDCRMVDRAEAIARVPVLATAAFERAAWTPSDGVVDIHALLWRYLGEARARGARLVPSCPVVAVETAGGRVVAVRTPHGRVACRVLVDAAGAWANRVAGLAGLAPLPMAPFRRHVAVTPPVAGVDPAWPFVWHDGAGVYFRPEVGGLLLSPCDQVEVPVAPAVRDPAAIDLLAEKLARHVPALAGVAVKRWWAGLRTLTRDGRFAIGPDPRLEGFVWVAGLGGHGMTASAFAGDAGAAAVMGREVPGAAAMRPLRLLPAVSRAS